MSFGLNAAQARAKANADLILFEEVYAIMKEVITQSPAGAYEAYVDDLTTMTASNPQQQQVKIIAMLGKEQTQTER